MLFEAGIQSRYKELCVAIHLVGPVVPTEAKSEEIGSCLQHCGRVSGRCHALAATLYIPLAGNLSQIARMDAAVQRDVQFVVEESPDSTAGGGISEALSLSA